MHYKTVNNKGAQIDPIKLIILFVIIGIVAAVLLFWFNKSFGQEIDIIDDRLDSLDDQDNDGKPDFIRDTGSDADGSGQVRVEDDETQEQDR